jgi:hypothetical protein
MKKQKEKKEKEEKAKEDKKKKEQPVSAMPEEPVAVSATADDYIKDEKEAASEEPTQV